MEGSAEPALGECRDCPFRARAQKECLRRCLDCKEHPCPTLQWYQEHDVNQAYQLSMENKEEIERSSPPKEVVRKI